MLITNKNLEGPLADSVENIYKLIVELGMDEHLNMDVVHENLSTFDCKKDESIDSLMKYDWENNVFLINPSKDKGDDFEYNFTKELMLLLINDKSKEPGLNKYPELSAFDEGVRSLLAETIVGDASENKEIDEKKVISNLIMVGSDLDGLLKAYLTSDSVTFAKLAMVDKKLIHMVDYDNKYNNENERKFLGEIQNDIQETLFAHLEENGVSKEVAAEIMDDFALCSVDNKSLMRHPNAYESVEAAAPQTYFEAKTKAA